MNKPDFSQSKVTDSEALYKLADFAAKNFCSPPRSGKLNKEAFYPTALSFAKQRPDLIKQLQRQTREKLRNGGERSTSGLVFRFEDIANILVDALAEFQTDKRHLINRYPTEGKPLTPAQVQNQVSEKLRFYIDETAKDKGIDLLLDTSIEKVICQTIEEDMQPRNRSANDWTRVRSFVFMSFEIRHTEENAENVDKAIIEAIERINKGSCNVAESTLPKLFRTRISDMRSRKREDDFIDGRLIRAGLKVDDAESLGMIAEEAYAKAL